MEPGFLLGLRKFSPSSPSLFFEETWERKGISWLAKKDMMGLD